MERTGKLNLIRTEREYQAGFCILSKKDTYTAERWLHPQELAHLRTLLYEKRRTSYLLGRIAAKKAIITLFPTLNATSVWIDAGIFGFPVVRCPALHNIKVCISHCEELGVAIAYPEEHPLGIDLEYIDPEQMTAIASQMQENEKRLLTTLPLEEVAAYTALWSVKEAVSKILMTGLTITLDSLAIETFTKSHDHYHCTFTNISQYRAVTLVYKHYVFSLVLPQKTSLSLTELSQRLDTVLN